MTIPPPPEWAPHDAVWIGFPSHPELWADDLAAARAEVAAFARAVHAEGRGERVLLVAADAEAGAAARAHASFAKVVVEPFGDIWLRDTGPIVLGDGRAADFDFNGWGGKYDLPGDDTIGQRLARRRGLATGFCNWVLEGGAVDGDGSGLAVTTAQCLLHPNRNPGMNQRRCRAPAVRGPWFRPGGLAWRRAAPRPYRRPCRQPRALRRARRRRDPGGGGERPQLAGLSARAARRRGGRADRW